jgi:hypothetical protein
MARRKLLRPVAVLGAWALAGALLLVPHAGEAAAPAGASNVIKVDAKVGLSGLVALTESHLKKMADALQLVAAGEEAGSAKWERLEPRLRWVRDHNVPAAVWFARPDGSYWSVDAGKAAGNLSDRPYFPKVLGGEVSIGTLVVSKSTERDTAIVAVPISREGKTIGILGASVFLDQLSQLLGEQLAITLPLLFYAFDSTAQVAINWRQEFIFLRPGQLHSASLSRAIDQMLKTSEGSARYELEGQQRVVVYRKSALLGWWFVFGQTSASPTR